ncbi:MAG: 23S rRNA (guanosine(2251)-2'-O)-methyltransferase RlmB [Bdellovibrionota bacterium]
MMRHKPKKSGPRAPHNQSGRERVNDRRFKQGKSETRPSTGRQGAPSRAAAPKRNDNVQESSTPQHQLVFGRKPILELARHRPRAIKHLFVRSGAKPGPELNEAFTALEAAGARVDFCTAAELDDLLPGANHQGLIASVTPREPETLENLIKYSKRAHGLLVALDEVQDPHNLGSILRAADAAGADGVLMPRAHSAGLTAAARKVSAGASELIRTSLVPNLARALETLKGEGFWIVGTALDESSQSLYSVDLAAPLVVVLGGEADGLRRLTKTLCDYIVDIPMEGHVQSLNVGQAAAVTLFEIRRKLARPKGS